MCTEQSHPNNKKEIRHGSFKRFKSCFIFQLNRVVSVEFMCSYTSTLRDGRMTLRVIPSRNGAPASNVTSLLEQALVFHWESLDATGRESATAEEWTVYSNRCIVDTVRSFPTTAISLYYRSNCKYSGM